jgi:hypothetical protein
VVPLKENLKRIFAYGLPMVVIVLFILIMLSGSLLKRPFSKSDDFIMHIDSLTQDIKNKDWKSAKTEMNKVDRAWKLVSIRVQFSEERDQMNEMDINLARIKGAIKVKDKNAAIIEISEAHEHWNDMGS